MNNSKPLEKNSTDFQALYKETEIWISQLRFYTDEMRFLQKLLDRYFSEMLEHENLDEMRESIVRFQDIRYQCGNLLARTEAHRNKLVKTIEHAVEEASKKNIQKHKELHDLMASFNQEARTIKKEIFYITELVLEMKNKEIH